MYSGSATLLIRLALISLLFAAVLPAAPAGARASNRPVVVELYTAQGCDSCAEADKLMGELAQRKDVLPLTFSVDYWDYLGWKDTFAAPEFGDRQRAFVDRLRVRDIYTPEVVVDGRAEAPGIDAERIEKLIRSARSADRTREAPRIRLNRRGTRVELGYGRALRPGDVWLVRYDSRPKTVRVRGDDGRSRPVTAYNVVRDLVRLGAWRGRARSFALPPSRSEGLSTLVLLQTGHGGPIIAAVEG